MSDDDKQFIKTTEIVLDKSAVFHHKILMMKNKIIIESIQVDPDPEMEIFFEIIDEWKKVKEKYHAVTKISE